MRIAQVAPLVESVPPKLYGGTERVVSYLTDELVERGHEVTLFASGDSVTSAKLVSVCPHSTRWDPSIKDPWVYLIAQIGLVYDHADEFDLIHSHVDYFTFPLARHVRTPTVTTMHGRLDLPELQSIYRAYPEMNLISISHDQRSPLPKSRWIATVYNGIRVEDFTLETSRGDYLAFLGRITPEKGIATAIEVAKRTGRRLKIAAKVDRVDEDYFERIIKPEFTDPLIEYVGEIDQTAKNQFLGQAYALLFPISWPEPFGLAAIEAMACGVPVVALRCASVPEIVVDGTTGFICDSIDEIQKTLEKVDGIDRRTCRRHVEKCFSVNAIVDAYEDAYKKILAGHAEKPGGRRRRHKPSCHQTNCPSHEPSLGEDGS